MKRKKRKLQSKMVKMMRAVFDQRARYHLPAHAQLHGRLRHGGEVQGELGDLNAIFGIHGSL